MGKNRFHHPNTTPDKSPSSTPTERQSNGYFDNASLPPLIRGVCANLTYPVPKRLLAPYASDAEDWDCETAEERSQNQAGAIWRVRRPRD